MKEPLRLLLVEDSDDDAELLLRELRKGGFEPRSRRVCDAAGLRAALSGGEWDAAILDYDLPGFHAPLALTLFRDLRPHVPVIVVSGAVRDETAVETLESGACDYVLKDNLTRLVPSLRRAVCQARARHEHLLDRAARDVSERRYRLLFERSLAGVMETTRQGIIVAANPALVEMLGYASADDLLGRHAAELYWEAGERCRLLSALRDGGSVSGWQQRLRRADGRELWLLADIVSVTHEDGSASLFGVALDVSELRATQESLAASLGQLRRTFGETVQCLASLTELRDPYTAGHQRRVAQLAEAIAVRLDVGRGCVDGLRVAATLHDIGKMHVPAEILARPGRLSDVEMAIIRQHPGTGHEILRSVAFPWPVADIVLQHHERHDGSGYPHGLCGDDLLLEAQILAVADIVEAMSSHRPYRAAHGIEHALAHVQGLAGRSFRREITDACLQVWQADGFAFTVPERIGTMPSSAGAASGPA